jgi:hypothetical protein
MNKIERDFFFYGECGNGRRRKEIKRKNKKIKNKK